MRNKILALILALAGLCLAAPSKVHAQAASVGPIGGGGGGGGGDAQTADPLSQFAATSCAQFASVITGETGSCGSVVLSSGPRFGSTVTFGTASSNTGIVRLEHAGHAFFNAFQQSATQAEDITYTLPTTNGGVSEFLQSNGSGVLTWAAAGGGITVGTTTITSGTDTRVPYNNAGVYGEDAGLTWASATDILTMLGGATIGSVTTAARAKHQFLDTISGSSTTSNWYNMTGTFPGTLSAETSAVLVAVTGDNDTSRQSAIKATFAALANTSTVQSAAIYGATTGAVPAFGGYFTNASSDSFGVVGVNTGTGVGTGGFFGAQGGSSRVFGAIGSGGNGSTEVAESTGVFGIADSDSATGAAGVWGRLNASTLSTGSSLPTLTLKAAGVFDNTTTTSPGLIVADNGTAVFTIPDGGQPTGRATSATADWIWTNSNSYGFEFDGGSGTSTYNQVGSGDFGFDGFNGRGKFMFDYSEAASTSTLNKAFFLSNSPGNTSAGFGTGLRLLGQSSTTADQDMVTYGTQWDVATHASRTSKAVIQTVNAAGALADAFVVGGTTVASAATIAVTANAVHISGTTNIDTITAKNPGYLVHLIFDGVLTVGDASNLKLFAAFVTTADDTLTLICDGTNWFEVARSVN